MTDKNCERTGFIDEIGTRLRKIDAINQDINRFRGELLHEETKLLKLELELEQEQLTLKHEYMEHGFKSTEAKERSKLDTRTRQLEIIDKQGTINIYKKKIEQLRQERKLLYTYIQPLMQIEGRNRE